MKPARSTCNEFTVEVCRRQLGDEAETLTDAEVLELRDRMVLLADVLLSSLPNQMKRKKA